MNAVFMKLTVKQMKPIDESCTALEQNMNCLSLKMSNNEHIVWNKNNSDHLWNWLMRRKVFDVDINIVYNCIVSVSPILFPYIWRLTEMKIRITLSTAAVCIVFFKVLLCVLLCSRLQLASKQLKIFILTSVFCSLSLYQCELIINETYQRISHNLPDIWSVKPSVRQYYLSTQNHLSTSVSLLHQHSFTSHSALSPEP